MRGQTDRLVVNYVSAEVGQYLHVLRLLKSKKIFYSVYGIMWLDWILLYLRERFGKSLQSELKVAELAVAGAGGREPVLQTNTVHHRQRPGTLTGR